uniref:Uncharacterized protein n=1 Tax=Anopheles culicifacies TaxID=139723 RepID=A0A182MTH6_9DIPT
MLEGIAKLNVNSNYFPCGCHIRTLLDSPLENGSNTEHDGAPAILMHGFDFSTLTATARHHTNC